MMMEHRQQETYSVLKDNLPWGVDRILSHLGQLHKRVTLRIWILHVVVIIDDPQAD